MGQLTMRVGSTKTIAEISRDSYVEEWRGSMMRRIPKLKKRCLLMLTEMRTPNTLGSVSGRHNDIVNP